LLIYQSIYFVSDAMERDRYYVLGIKICDR